MSNATPETQRTITLEITDEVSVCLAFFDILPLALQRYLGFDDAVLELAFDVSIEAMASMIEEEPE
jgi:hypothetical protein